MGKNYSHTRKGNIKKLAVTVAALLAASGIVGGAFAWTDFNQSRTNKFRGASSFDAEVTLHDEFAEEKEPDGSRQKDVFVENAGTKEIYVRVRLDEFMQVGPTSLVKDVTIKDKERWLPHLYGNTATNTPVVNAFDTYFTWEQKGSDRKFQYGIGGMVYTSLDPTTRKPARDSGENPTAAPAAPALMSVYVPKLERYNALLAKEKANTLTDPEKAELDTLKIEMSKPRWILDDTTMTAATPEEAVKLAVAAGAGWAYWSVPLKEKQATNLLLESVTEKSDEIAKLEEDWTYRIDVKLQAVTFNDLAKWNDLASTIGYKLTDNAKRLCKVWGAEIA